MIITLPPGSHRISLDYGETPVRRTGRLITIASFSAMVGLLLLALFWDVSKRSVRRESAIAAGTR
jgi:hypothetical protein